MNNLFSNSLIVVIGLMLAISLSTISHAQVTFFSDFECNCWSDWSSNPTISPSSNSSLVNDSSNYGGATSKQWAAQQKYLAGWTDSGGVSWMNTGKAVLPSQFLVEYDFKLSSNYHFPLGQKMWRVMPDMNSGAGANDTTANMQMNNYGNTLTFEVFSNSTTFGNRENTIFASIAKPTVNVWHRIGWRFKKNTFSGSTPNEDGETEIFFDGISVGRRTNVRLTAVTTRWFRDYWGGPGNYTSVIDNNPISQDQWIRIDNFKITDLSGGGGSTLSSPPLAPKDLKLSF